MKSCKFENMANKQTIIFTPEEKAKKLSKVLIEVRKQVRQYETAKSSGTLKKIDTQSGTHLFNV
jgi:hypothetical protein